MFDRHGGAERVAWDLFNALRRRGHDSWFTVGRKRSDDPDVLVLPNHETPCRWSRFWWRVHHCLQPVYGRLPGARLLCRAVHRLAEPEGLWDSWRGREDFRYPGTWRLLDLAVRPPDLVHCHNLHQKYFDLRALPWLSRQVPVVLTLHDAWLLSGHCAHSFDCERWRTGCGNCPDLTIYPAIRRDATAENWRRKRDIFAASHLHVATPCRWLMNKVEQSMLAPGVAEARVIPNGVDLNVFRPADRIAARAATGLPENAHILLFAASGIRGNIWKDYRTLRSAVARLAERIHGRQLLFVALGETAPPEHIGNAEIRFVPFQHHSTAVARFYQSADVYIHAARVDTFPNTVLEALACGTPVVGTAVGGVPEQIHALPFPGTPRCVSPATAERATGALVACGDDEGMAAAIETLFRDESMRRRLGENASADARQRFDLNREVDDYLAWYCHLLAKQPATTPEPLGLAAGAANL
jgi:glycosyltransferase involved in cell wall biosynthesis